MMPQPVALYLARFGGEERSESAGEKLFDLVDFEEPIKTPAEDAGDDEQLSCERARDEGYADGFAAASREQEDMRRVERLAFEEQIVSDRARWAQDEGFKLGEKMEGALAEIETRIATSTARILRPFLAAQLRQKAIDELAGSLAQMLGGGEQPLVEIDGPEDLLAALQTRLAGSSARIVWMLGSSIEVRIIVDRTMIESRIQLWIQRIEASLK